MWHDVLEYFLFNEAKQIITHLDGQVDQEEIQKQKQRLRKKRHWILSARPNHCMTLIWTKRATWMWTNQEVGV